jgi:hypothetical protein
VSVKRPSRSSAQANATECTRRSSPPSASAASRDDALDVLVRAHVALGDERAVDASGELADALLDPLALVGERELRALVGEALAIAHAIDRLLATPRTRPRFPSKRFTVRRS